MDEGAWSLRKIDIFKERFLDVGGKKLYLLLI